MGKKSKKGKVRPLALCIIRRGDAILVAEGYDPVKQQTFYRPLGGGIEFGEYGYQTAARELLEEINEVVTVGRCIGALENIFTYNGAPGHEICLIYEATFVNEALYARESIEGRDDNKLLFIARWLPLDFFRRGAGPLYPDGLLELLDREVFSR